MLIFFLCCSFQATLAILDKLDIDTERPSDEEVARMFGYEEAYFSGTLTTWQKLKPKIWALFDEPYSSSAAKVPPTNVQHRNVIGVLLTILTFISEVVRGCTQGGRRRFPWERNLSTTNLVGK